MMKLTASDFVICSLLVGSVCILVNAAILISSATLAPFPSIDSLSFDSRNSSIFYSISIISFSICAIRIGFDAVISYLKGWTRLRYMRFLGLLLLLSTFLSISTLIFQNSFEFQLVVFLFMAKSLDVLFSSWRLTDNIDSSPPFIRWNRTVIMGQMTLHSSSYTCLLFYSITPGINHTGNAFPNDSSWALILSSISLNGAAGLLLYLYCQFRIFIFSNSASIYAICSLAWISTVDVALVALYAAQAIDSFALFGLFYLLSWVVASLISLSASSSELFELLTEIKDAAKSKRNFINYVSHEIRGPLSTAIMGLDLLRELTEGPLDMDLDMGERIRQISYLVTDVRASTDFACKTFSDLLTLDKMRFSKKTLTLESVHVLEFVKACVRPFRAQAAASQTFITWKTELFTREEVPLAGIEIDRFKMEQALRNFISNALKFTSAAAAASNRGAINVIISKRVNFSQSTPAAGIVAGDRVIYIPPRYRTMGASRKAPRKAIPLPVSTKHTLTPIFGGRRRLNQVSEASNVTPLSLPVNYNNSNINNFEASAAPTSRQPFMIRGSSNEVVRISVIDSGVGLSAENIVKMFQEYSQIDAFKLQQGKGSGLGLWLSKMLVEAQGGTVGVSSEGEGKGCEFFIELPLKILPAAVANSSSLSPGGIESGAVAAVALISPASAIRSNNQSDKSPGSGNSRIAPPLALTASFKSPSVPVDTSPIRMVQVGNRSSKSLDSLVTSAKSNLGGSYDALYDFNGDSLTDGKAQNSIENGGIVAEFGQLMIVQRSPFVRDSRCVSSMSYRSPHAASADVMDESAVDFRQQSPSLSTTTRMIPSSRSGSVSMSISHIVSTAGRFRGQGQAPQTPWPSSLVSISSQPRASRARHLSFVSHNADQHAANDHFAAAAAAAAAAGALSEANDPNPTSQKQSQIRPPAEIVGRISSEISPRSGKQSQQPEQRDRRRYRILIVDDSKLARKMVTRTLNSMISSYDEADSGSEALRIVQRSLGVAVSTSSKIFPPFDIVLLDHSMPGELSGPAAVCAIREAGYSGFLFGLTASHDEEVSAEFLRAGADACILKPITTALLSSLLESLNRTSGSRK